MNLADRHGHRVNLQAANAGLVYFLVVFAAGFAIGMLRVFFITPLLGETVAVLFELPVLLALSWLACQRLIARFGVSPNLSPRLIMGALAFVVLLVAEFGISKFALGRTLADHLNHIVNCRPC